MKKNHLANNLRKRSNSGLTLVELIIAMAIVAVLASIAIPAYKDYQEKARIAQAVHDMAHISIKLGQYWQDARTYPDTLGQIGLATIDPWGSPYQYYNIEKNGIGHARKDRKLNPLNTDFDLYSKGKDKASMQQLTNKKSLDDVIRANDGKFMDLAEKY